MQMPAWTFSQLEKFETCPKQFYHVRVARDVIEPPTEATIWGERVHTALEYRIKDGTPLPEGMTQWEPLAKKLAALPGEKHTEFKMSLDRNFQPTDWKNSWTRGIVDLTVIHKDKAFLVDYKTGKRKLTDQLKLYAAYTFSYYPQIRQVTTGFAWLKDKKLDKETVTRDEVAIIWQPFLAKVRKLESAYERDSWPPRPSGLCRGWCPVKACDHYRSK